MNKPQQMSYLTNNMTHKIQQDVSYFYKGFWKHIWVNNEKSWAHIHQSENATSLNCHFNLAHRV